ncbi:MAG: SH3 domain-containing protein, partial [Bryobacterales bacterium]|nr:SH3 domain-containing protein [Bryobacterales bacterium]
MQPIRSYILAGFVCLLGSCSSEPPKARAIGEAYVGPASVLLRSDLSTRSDKLAELKFGEKLEILQTRRALVKVRNMGGSEGWVDGKHLLTIAQMSELRRTIDAAAAMPAQGKAKVFDALNVHSEPNRQSPSPFQIPPGGTVDVLARKVEPRVAYRSLVQALLNAPAPKKARKKKGKGKEKEEQKEEQPEVPPPPMPRAPGLPEDWQELSRTELPADPARPQPRADDWSLVRLGAGKAGWVLSRMLYMNIPDEVAQYSEGKRITSYFALGEVQQDGTKRHHWLWTTLSKPLEDHDFDGWRVFIYNSKRGRYETAYRENETAGFLPVLQETVEVTENNKAVKAPGFTLITEDKEG